MISGGVGRVRLLVLIYHRVLAAPDPLRPWEPDKAAFIWQMELLTRQFSLISLGDAVQGLRDGSLPPRAACVTFDDGYADNFSVALPILKEMQIPATFFVATGFLGGGRMWNDTVIESVRHFPERTLDLTERDLGIFDISTDIKKYGVLEELLLKLKYFPPERRRDEVAFIEGQAGTDLPNDMMMSPEQVRKLHSSGMEIGAHTVNHPILANIDLAEATKEMQEGKDYLEKLLGGSVRLFAYPNGKPGQDYRAEHVVLAQELGFEAAVSTAWGAATAGTDFWQIPRFTPWDNKPPQFYMRLLYNYFERDALREVALLEHEGERNGPHDPRNPILP